VTPALDTRPSLGEVEVTFRGLCGGVRRAQLSRRHMAVIDLNSDLGELAGPSGRESDRAVLEVVTSANVACGFHAGDLQTMADTVRVATRRGVVVGAHVSYRDQQDWGRRPVDLDATELSAQVIEQLQALDEVARAAGTKVAYVKAHGALYHRMAVDTEQAQAVISAMLAHDPSLVLLTLPGSVAMHLAQRAGLEPGPRPSPTGPTAPTATWWPGTYPAR